LSTWRLLDTGLRPPAENFAINRALLESHAAGESPDTLRFLRFTPSALVGFHQDVEQELHVDYCRERGITVQRRLTGGGAIVFDPSHLGWELYTGRRALGSGDMQAIAERICVMAAQGLRRLGLDARFRPRNDIEVGGRKVSGTGGVVEGDSLLYQGTLLLDLDVERMLRVLKVPAEKLTDKAIASVRERVVSVRDLLGRVPPLEEARGHLAAAFAKGLGVELAPAGGLNAAEQVRYARALAEIDSEAWVYQTRLPAERSALAEAMHRVPGGTLRAALLADPVARRIKQCWLTGDFFVNPARSVPDLEAALKDCTFDALEATVQGFFAEHAVDMAGLVPDDFAAVLRRAVAAA
jgi:lipoate-protein ligase A